MDFVFFFWVLFCVESFFSLYVSIKPKKFFITKNVVITYNLSTIKGFYHKERDFATDLVFLSFYCSPRVIAKKRKEIEIKEFVAGCEHVNT